MYHQTIVKPNAEEVAIAATEWLIETIRESIAATRYVQHRIVRRLDAETSLPTHRRERNQECRLVVCDLDHGG